MVEVILSESTDIIRMRPGLVIAVHRLGFIMANAGVDQSNVAQNDGSMRALLLPQNPDASCDALKARLEKAFGVRLGIVINDSFGRPWRNGVVGVAIGAAGVPSVRNLIGSPDLFGRPLRVTEIAVADELASAASLVMGQAAEGVPVVHIRGARWEDAPLPASALVRPKHLDLFR
jgi:coenzyme F420-0:L-glutamate ligase/coenzyme F420-1:gamma-L-glutamate ligase